MSSAIAAVGHAQPNAPRGAVIAEIDAASVVRRSASGLAMPAPTASPSERTAKDAAGMSSYLNAASAPAASPPFALPAPQLDTDRGPNAPALGVKAMPHLALVDSFVAFFATLSLRVWGAIILGALALLVLAWHMRRKHRARRNALRVWNPGRLQRGSDLSSGLTQLPEISPIDALETPVWLANVIRQKPPAAPEPWAPAAPAVAHAPSVADASSPSEAPPATEPCAALMVHPDESAEADAVIPPEAEVSMPEASPQAPAQPAFEYSTQMSAMQGAVLGPQPPQPLATLHVDRDDRHASPVSPPSTLHDVAAVDLVSFAEDKLQANLALARRLATQDRPREALAALRPCLGAHAPATAWAIAGWSAWKLAQRDRDPLPAAREAADAFAAALAGDPSRRSSLSRMIGRCHLLQADADVPVHRLEHLRQAAHAYEHALVDSARPSNAGLMEWANAVAELATHAASDDRAQWLAQLDAVLARAAEAAGATPAWCKLRAQAAWLHALAAPASAARARWHEQAVAELRAGYDRLEQGNQRDSWLADSIDAERRYLGGLSQAARAAGVRDMEARVRDPLEQARSPAPWLKWVHALADGARSLQGPAARQRLAEAGAAFERLEALPASKEERQGIAFARAYYLRLRGLHEHGHAREQVLDHASRLLAELRQSDFPSVGAVAMEQAEVALAQAGDGQDEVPRYREAVAHASAAADFAPTRQSAFCALLTALLGWQRRLPEQARTVQIATVAQWLREADAHPSADTLRLLAAAAMTADDVAEAARLSAAAWEAGAERSAVLPGWQRADAEWAKRLAGAERLGWERQHRQLRLAVGTR